MSTLEAIGLFVVGAGLFALVDVFFAGVCCVAFGIDDEDSWIPCLLIGAAIYGGTMILYSY